MHKNSNRVSETCPCGRLLTLSLEIICDVPGSDLTLKPGPAAKKKRARTRTPQRQLSQGNMSTPMTTMQMRQLKFTSTSMTPPGPPKEKQPAATQEKQPAGTHKSKLCSYCDKCVVNYRCRDCGMTLCNQCAQPCPVQYERGCYQLYCPEHLRTHRCKSSSPNADEKTAKRQHSKQHR